MSDDIFSVATGFADVASLAQGYMNRADGERLLSRDWIDASWQPRTQSRFTGDDYGYGWFLREIAGEPVRYAWGYGGQMLYVVPSLGLTVAMTSDDGEASARSGHRDSLHGLAAEIIASVRQEVATGRPDPARRQACATPAGVPVLC